MSYWEEMDFPGNDLKNYFGVSGHQECAKLCLDEEACVAFTYVPETHPYAQLRYSCWLKKASNSWRIVDSGNISGYKCNYDFNPKPTGLATGLING